MARQSKRQRGATMQDVAELVHVSRQTVSAVINNKPGITEETRARVRAAIAQVNYRMDLTARSLRTGLTNTVALIVTDISNPFAGKMASIAEERVYAEHYNLVLYNTHDDLDREQFYVDSILQRSVDGVMFVSARDESTALNKLEAAGIPVVVVDRVPHNYHGPAVVLDNLAAGNLGMQHLLGLGHTQIAHISGPGQVHIARERLAGARAAIASCGQGDLAVQEADGWHLRSGYDSALRLLRADEKFTAVYCGGDLLAIGAQRALREAGLRIPEDVSLMGIDNIDLAAYLSPPLTTVIQSIDKMATLGVELLFDLLAGKGQAQHRIIVAPELIVRESTMPPAMHWQGAQHG
jgi:DNA-binding LacI/PurR family transcriptional regulator